MSQILSEHNEEFWENCKEGFRDRIAISFKLSVVDMESQVNYTHVEWYPAPAKYYQPHHSSIGSSGLSDSGLGLGLDFDCMKMLATLSKLVQIDHFTRDLQ